ncbi:MAG TPA: 3-dehydroquinate synthase II [Methanocorpusculum sp.]|nr:3-dehydroquinate synthase II [Methanocorpusculum sp.]
MTVPGSAVLIRADRGTAEERRRIVESALESGFTFLLLEEGDDRLAHLGRMTVIYRLADTLFFDGEPVGKIYTIDSADALDAIGDTDELAVVATPGWTVIPLENLISRLHHTKIYAQVSTPEEASLAREILEKGCAGIAVDAPASALPRFMPQQADPEIRMTPARIVRIDPVPLSDRVCVDTTSMLDPAEGLLVGSTSSCFFQVCSENHPTEYAAARPFRVNAGAVHSYVKIPGDRTQYLSELAAGTKLMTRTASGSTREVTTGRIKIERRPMLLIEAELPDGTRGSVVVQNAETVRIMAGTGPVSVADLQVGDTVLVYVEPAGGRHFGTRIDETVREL